MMLYLINYLLIRIAAAVFISVIAYSPTLAEFVKTAAVGNSTSQRLIKVGEWPIL